MFLPEVKYILSILGVGDSIRRLALATNLYFAYNVIVDILPYVISFFLSYAVVQKLKLNEPVSEYLPGKK